MNTKVKIRGGNPDPITDEAVGHPVGTGVGMVLGGAGAGAAMGTMAGPVGTAIGAAVGAVAGGLAGKSVAETFDPTVEDAWWRENYSSRPYVARDASYDDYGPAYAYGVHAYRRDPDCSYDAVEQDLGRDWEQRRGSSSLDWDRAKLATRDAWHRARNAVERAVRGDSDGDGR